MNARKTKLYDLKISTRYIEINAENLSLLTSTYYAINLLYTQLATILLKKPITQIIRHNYYSLWIVTLH